MQKRDKENPHGSKCIPLGLQAWWDREGILGLIHFCVEKPNNPYFFFFEQPNNPYFTLRQVGFPPTQFVRSVKDPSFSVFIALEAGKSYTVLVVRNMQGLVLNQAHKGHSSSVPCFFIYPPGFLVNLVFFLLRFGFMPSLLFLYFICFLFIFIPFHFLLRFSCFSFLLYT